MQPAGSATLVVADFAAAEVEPAPLLLTDKSGGGSSGGGVASFADKFGALRIDLPAGLAPIDKTEGLRAQLEFGGDAAEELFGSHIIFKWVGHGWAVGEIRKRNVDSTKLLVTRRQSKEAANFMVYYEVDDALEPHGLELDDYATSFKSPVGTWCLLGAAPEGAANTSTAIVAVPERFNTARGRGRGQGRGRGSGVGGSASGAHVSPPALLSEPVSGEVAASALPDVSALSAEQLAELHALIASKLPGA